MKKDLTTVKVGHVQNFLHVLVYDISRKTIYLFKHKNKLNKYDVRYVYFTEFCKKCVNTFCTSRFSIK